MKTRHLFALCFILFHSSLVPSARAQGTGFTYQGRLTVGTNPANGSYDLKFSLYDANQPAGTLIAGPLTNSATVVSNGLFAIVLDFGNVFPGADRWLEIGVRTNGNGAFTTLAARQRLTAAPYAITAGNLSGTLASAQLAGSYAGALTLSNAGDVFYGAHSGNGTGLTNVNATLLGGLAASNYWQLGGNNVASGQYLGSTNNQAVEILAYGSRALRLEPVNTNGSPNIVGGSSVNVVANGVVGATISGGGARVYGAMAFNPGTAFTNRVTGDFGTVSGGAANIAGNSATVGGGYLDNASGGNATIGGGYGNIASGGNAFVGGGQGNTASGTASTASGGSGNIANNDYSTVGGGLANAASGYYATVAGGGGEIDHNFLGDFFVPAGNTASGNWSAIGGGESNTASGYYATISGGYGNVAAGDYSFAAGYHAQAQNSGSFVWNDGSGGAFASTADNQFAVHASGGVLLAGNVQMGTNASDYRHFTLGGGNSFGYLYGAYPTFGDGIHLGYNIYYDANGNGHIGNPGGATSRITAGYGVIKLDIGGVNAQPNTDRLVADSSGVAVYGTFNNSSDRNAKQDFASVSASEILDKVLQLPVSEWSYKTDAGTRHLGPMGQDFYATFNIGTDGKHIAPIDESGVALAAIQGLNEKVDSGKQKAETQIQELKAENAELKARLSALEKIILNQKSN